MVLNKKRKINHHSKTGRKSWARSYAKLKAWSKIGQRLKSWSGQRSVTWSIINKKEM